MLKILQDELGYSSTKDCANISGKDENKKTDSNFQHNADIKNKIDSFKSILMENIQTKNEDCDFEINRESLSKLKRRKDQLLQDKDLENKENIEKEEIEIINQKVEYDSKITKGK
jgi:hypothetical protein